MLKCVWGNVVSLSASEIDRHVGLRMRERREALGISQGRLGRHLGLTFSQIQKYEKGSNRIGAGRLYQIAAYLAVSIGYFFEGLERNEAAAADQRHPPTPQVPDDQLRDLAEAFSAIAHVPTRAAVLALVRSLAGLLPSRRSIGR